MLVIGIDVETTGVDKVNDEIIELGAVVWDTEANKPVAMLNHLVQQPSKGCLSQKIVDLTGITDDDLVNFGIDESQAIREFLKLARKCEYVVAHNGNNFDKFFIDKALSRIGEVLGLPWIDSMTDIPYSTTTRKLTYLAAEHNFLNPFRHRALFDVLTMLEICSKYDWKDTVSRSLSKTILVVAKVSKENRHLAKNKGFRWDSENIRWVKTMKDCDLKSANLNFEYTID